MPFAHSVGAHIHYEVTGRGSEPLLLIMGLGGHASEWGEPFVSRLEPHFRVIRMDNRGIESSQAEGRAWSMRDMADDALAVLDAAGEPRACIAGTSMGGMIAQTLALAHPERVGRLILMSTHFGGSEVLSPLPAAIAVLLPAPGIAAVELQRCALSVLTAPGFAAAHPELVEQLAQLRAATPTRGRVFKAQFNAIAADDRAAQVHSLGMPTLVIHGQADPLIPVDNGKLLAARIPGAQLVLLDGCGHFPHVELPEQTAAAIVRFCAADPVSAPSSR